MRDGENKERKGENIGKRIKKEQSREKELTFRRTWIIMRTPSRHYLLLWPCESMRLIWLGRENKYKDANVEKRRMKRRRGKGEGEQISLQKGKKKTSQINGGKGKIKEWTRIDLSRSVWTAGVRGSQANCHAGSPVGCSGRRGRSPLLQ